jgi:hypothetical protein
MKDLIALKFELKWYTETKAPMRLNKQWPAPASTFLQPGSCNRDSNNKTVNIKEKFAKSDWIIIELTPVRDGLRSQIDRFDASMLARDAYPVQISGNVQPGL